MERAGLGVVVFGRGGCFWEEGVRLVFGHRGELCELRASVQWSEWEAGPWHNGCVCLM
jgi:hypothetical protein